jgi:hypothetical protein
MQTYYSGPIVRDLGGADISWLVGFVVSAGVYLALARAWPIMAPRTGAAVPASALGEQPG